MKRQSLSYNKLDKDRSQCGAFLICVIPKAIKAADTANKERILPMNAAPAKAIALAINKYPDIFIITRPYMAEVSDNGDTQRS